MKRLRLSLLGSKALIYAAISLSFTCVLRCHKSSPKEKCQNLLSSNSVAEMYFPACLLANQNVHQLLNLGHLTTPDIPKRLSLIFLWVELFQRDPIPIVDSLLKPDCIFGGRWDAHFYLDSLSHYFVFSRL